MQNQFIKRGFTRPHVLEAIGHKSKELAGLEELRESLKTEEGGYASINEVRQVTKQISEVQGALLDLKAALAILDDVGGDSADTLKRERDVWRARYMNAAHILSRFGLAGDGTPLED